MLTSVVMARLYMLILALALPACAPERRAWSVESPELAAPARAAAEAWCTASAGEFCPGIDDPRGAPIRVSTRDDAPGLCGTFTYPSRMITVVTECVDAQECLVFDPAGALLDREATLVAILAHELGHAAQADRGMPVHSSDPGSLMHAPVLLWDGHVAPADVEFVLGAEVVQ